MKARLAVVVGIVLSAALLVAVFYRLDWPLFLAALRQVRVGGLLAAAGVIVLAILARAWRWRLLHGNDGKLLAHFQAACVGYFGNVVYPAKAGELLRVLALARAESAPVARALVSAMTDRLNDVLVLLLMACVIVALHGDRVLGTASRIVSGIAIAGIALVVIALIGRGKALKSGILWLAGRVPSRTREWAATVRDAAGELVGRLRDPRLIGLVLVANVCAMLADYTAIWLALQACGLDLPYSAAITVGVFLSAGQSLPSSPGYVGIYQLAVVLALSLYSIPQAPALAASLVLHLSSICVFAVLGVWAISALGSGIFRRRSVDEAYVD